MADSEQKGNELLAEAEAKLRPGSFLTNMFGGGSRIEDACELYCRAANSFKMAKKWAAAGDAFSKAGELRLKTGSRHEGATCFIDAATSYKKCEPKRAVQCCTKAIEIYTDMGRFTMAAKQHIVIAELYESELNDIDKAMEHYEQASDYYKGEESFSAANKCLLSVAKYAAQLEKYERAIEIYEQVASHSLDSSLLKYSAKEYFFRAALCHLCIDTLNATHALAKYDEQCPSFIDSREYKLVKTLIGKLEDQDIEGLTQAIADYDSISKLDQWYTTLLLRIKRTLSEEPDLC